MFHSGMMNPILWREELGGFIMAQKFQLQRKKNL
jgi:hypothetical protein